MANLTKEEKVEKLISTYNKNNLQKCYSPRLRNIPTDDFPSDDNQYLAETIIDDLLLINSIGVNYGFDSKIKKAIKGLNGILDRLRSDAKRYDKYSSQVNKFMQMIPDPATSLNYKMIYSDLLTNTIDGMDEIKATLDTDMARNVCDQVKEGLQKHYDKLMNVIDFRSYDAAKNFQELLATAYEFRDRIAGGALVPSEVKSIFQELDESLDKWIDIKKAGKPVKDKDIVKLDVDGELKPVNQIKFSKVEDTFKARTKSKLFLEKYDLLKEKLKASREGINSSKLDLKEYEDKLNELNAKKKELEIKKDEINMRIDEGELTEEEGRIQLGELLDEMDYVKDCIDLEREKKDNTQIRISDKNLLVGQVDTIISQLDLYKKEPIMLGIFLDEMDLQPIISLLDGNASTQAIEEVVAIFNRQLTTAKAVRKNMIEVINRIRQLKASNRLKKEELGSTSLRTDEEIKEREDRINAMRNSSKKVEEKKEEEQNKKQDVDAGVF